VSGTVDPQALAGFGGVAQAPSAADAIAWLRSRMAPAQTPMPEQGRPAVPTAFAQGAALPDNPLARFIAGAPIGTEHIGPQLTNATPLGDRVVGMGPGGVPVMASDAARAHAAVQQAWQTAPTMALGMVGGLGEVPKPGANVGRMDAVQHMLDHVSADPGSKWGLRITDDPIDLNSGILPPSRVWDDGKPTGDVLGGTSTVGINGNTRAAVERALADAGVAPYGKAHQYYPGQHVTLVKGDYAGGGDDVGEAIIRNATPVATYQKVDSGPSALLPVAPPTAATPPGIRAFHGSPQDGSQ
jgi:hypothetical protein